MLGRERLSDGVHRGGHLRSQRGYALLWVLFSFVVMSALASAALRSASTSRRSAKVSKEWDKGMYVAEAGLNQVLPTCTDSLVNGLNPGDSLDLGWTTMETGDRYRPVIYRIDGDEGDKLYLVNVQGRASSRFGGTPSVSAVVSLAPRMPPAAIAVNGNLDIDAGTTTILGDCTGVSVTGGLDVDNSTLITDGEIQTGSIGLDLQNGGRVIDSSGNETTATTDADFSGVPLLSTSGFCSEADYIMRNGWVVRTGAEPDSAMAGTGAAAAWTWTMSSNIYRASTGFATPGTFCVNGNVEISGEIASPTAPLRLTILATGSIDVEGRTSIVPDHSSRMSLMAEGDVRLAQAGTNRIDGIVYARRHCRLVGSISMHGSLLCASAPASAEALVLYHENDISADLTLQSACTNAGGSAEARLKPLEHRAWMQRY